MINLPENLPLGISIGELLECYINCTCRELTDDTSDSTDVSDFTDDIDPIEELFESIMANNVAGVTNYVNQVDKNRITIDFLAHAIADDADEKINSLLVHNMDKEEILRDLCWVIREIPINDIAAGSTILHLSIIKNNSVVIEQLSKILSLEEFLQLCFRDNKRGVNIIHLIKDINIATLIRDIIGKESFNELCKISMKVFDTNINLPILFSDNIISTANISKSVSGDTIIHNAIRRKEYQMLNIYHQLIGDERFIEIINTVNDEGETVLHLAAASGVYDVCNQLYHCLKNNLFFAQTKEEKRTALHYAMITRSIPVIQLLINDYGKGEGLVGILDSLSFAPLHSSGNETVLKLLYDKMTVEQICSPVLRDSFKYSILQLAVQDGNVEIVKILLSNPEVAKKLLGQLDAFDQTALHIAASRNNIRVAEILCFLMTEQQINQISSFGSTAKEIAIKRNYTEIAECIKNFTK